MDLTFKLVLSSDGSIDSEASVEAARAAIDAYAADLATQSDTIGAAVHAVFDKHLGKRLPTPWVVNQVLAALNAQPDNSQSLEEKVRMFLTEHTDRQANKTKGIQAEPVGTRTFSVRKGAGGGIARTADLPPEPQE